MSPDYSNRSHTSRPTNKVLDTLPAASAIGKRSDVLGHNGKSSASDSARLKDVVDSYLRQLYGSNTATRVLAAQGLGALPSFLPPSRGSEALRLAVDLGVVGSLADVLAVDDERAVQDACLMALASLLLSTAPYEEHSAPLRPPHLKQLGDTLLRQEVVTQISYLVSATPTNTRVVLAGARVMAITAPYINQANDMYILESRIVPALLAAIAARPDSQGGGDSGEMVREGGGHGANSNPPISTPPRDAAACVLALLTLAKTTPDLYNAVCTADFLQATCVLYERCIHPDQTSDVVLPADAAALLLQAATQAPSPRWTGRLPSGHARSLEWSLEASEVPECLVSYLAVEAANLRRLGEMLAMEAADNASVVVEKIGGELEQLQSELRERRQELAEAKVAVQDARRRLEAVEAEFTEIQGEAALVAAAARELPRAVSNEKQHVRREAKAAIRERQRDAEAAEAALAAVARKVAAIRRVAAPLRWQSNRMAQLRVRMQSWCDEYGFKSKCKVKVTRPNMDTLSQVLAFLQSRLGRSQTASATPGPGGAMRPKSAGSSPNTAAGAAAASTVPLSPSREHVAALQTRILDAGLLQAVIQLHTVLGGVQSLVEQLAGLVGDLGLQPDMAAALEGAVGQLRREANGLVSINRRGEMRLQQVESEAARLRKALRLELPLTGGSPRVGSMELGPGNGLSRTVRQEDVVQRLEALNSEANDLTAALRDSEALVSFLRDRIQAVEENSSALSDSYAAFFKAFPIKGSPASPGTTPAKTATSSPAANGHHHNDANGAGNGQPHNRAPRLASLSVLAKNPSHPTSHLLGVLSRALAPVTRGSSLNLPALIRQLLGRSPKGTAPATWPPFPAGLASFDAVTESKSKSKSVGSAGLVGVRPSSAGGALGPQAYLSGRGPSAAEAARPSSARSATAGGFPTSERLMENGVSSLRASGGFGMNFGTLGYGGGFGGFQGFPHAGPYPGDGPEHTIRYPQESMHGIVQSALSPMRGYSAPYNGSRFARMLREKGATRSGSGGGDVGASRSMAVGATGALLNDVNAQPAPSTSFPDLMASVNRSLADESRHVVHQVVSSMLFDPIDVDVLEPGMLRASAASLSITGVGCITEHYGRRLHHGGLGSRPLKANRNWVATENGGPVVRSDVAIEGGEAAPDDVSADAVGGGGDVSVLDALLIQSELLCCVLGSLARLQQFAKSTIKMCQHLPASLSFESLQPGALGPYMARLHGMWAGAIARYPDIRVQVVEAVKSIAQLSLVPGDDFDVVYRDTGLVEVLIQMLASGLRLGGGRGDGGGAGKAKVKANGTKPGAEGAAAGAAGATEPKSLHVGRLSAMAVPTLRPSPTQQAEQVAAGRALHAISNAQTEVLWSISKDGQLLTRLSYLVLDHSMSWPARQAAADLLADLVLSGGQGAEAAVASGAYAGLVEMLNRDMFPFLNQDAQGSKETVVSALACLVAHPELLEGVVAAARAPHGPSSGMLLSCPEHVMSAILRTLWGVVWQVYSTFVSDRTGQGRYVDAELVSALMFTAATAARHLAVLAKNVVEARRVLANELRLRTKISLTFLQAIKDASLQRALVELRRIIL